MTESLTAPASHDLNGLLQSSEHFLVQAVEWLQLCVEAMGALIIGVGVIVALLGFIRTLLANGENDFFAVRLSLARYLALALEFQLGADILATAISPGWEQIGMLGAIAVIRTALNYFLMREMAMESAATSSQQQ